MSNLLRSLLFDGQVSITVADTTKAVQKAVQLHKLSPLSTYVFGKALSAMTFASACLKGERGEISLALHSDGVCGDIAVSGNQKLHMRGYISATNLLGVPVPEEEGKALGDNVTLTIIRDDGYARPFVGTCQCRGEVGIDAAMEEYYTISEQLPTRIFTTVKLDKKGKCTFAGVVALQPLPFADEKAKKETENCSLESVLANVEKDGIEKAVINRFGIDENVWEVREMQYKCNCSRRYLTRVLVSLGEEQMRQIILEDGKVEVHCHYCNKDYAFTQADADKLFAKKVRK